MNLHQLRAFVTVVDAGSFTIAARRLYVGQPSLSQQIRALEAELGGELLERLPRALRLTAAGEAFLPKARAAVQAADDAAGLARRAIAAGPGNLCLAVSPAVPSQLIADALARWARTADADADRSARWHEYDSQERVEEKAASGVGTVALALRPEAWSGPLVDVGHDDLVVVAPPGDELADASDPVALGALDDRIWIGIDRERSERDAVGAAFASAGFLPVERFETSRSAPALRLVSAGLGLALVPRAAVSASADVIVVELDDPPRRELVAFTDRPWTPTALDFLGVLLQPAGSVAD